MSNYKNPYFDDCEFEPECCNLKSKCHDNEPKSYDYEPKCHNYEPICPIIPSRVTVLQAISLVPQTVATLLAVPFDTNLVNLGTGIVHIPSGTDFNLLASGVYRVTFTGSVTPVGTDAGVAIASSGTIIPGTTVNETVVAGTIAALSTQAIIQVLPCTSAVVTIVNPTAGTETFTNPNIIIEKIG